MNTREALEPKKRDCRVKKQPREESTPPAPAQEVQIQEPETIAIQELPSRPQPRRPAGLLKRTGGLAGEGTSQTRQKTTLPKTLKARTELDLMVQVSPIVGESSTEIPTGIPICTMDSRLIQAVGSSQRVKYSCIFDLVYFILSHLYHINSSQNRFRSSFHGHPPRPGDHLQ